MARSLRDGDDGASIEASSSEADSVFPKQSCEVESRASRFADAAHEGAESKENKRRTRTKEENKDMHCEENKERTRERTRTCIVIRRMPTRATKVGRLAVGLAGIFGLGSVRRL